MAMQPYVALEQPFNQPWMENLILELSDALNIRVWWERETALVAGACALAGGLLGGYAGGRLGAALGAGVATAVGLSANALVPLREIWSAVRSQLAEIAYIVLNFLRRLDAVDYMQAAHLLLACRSSRRELALTLVEFIATKLGREVIFSITAG